MGPSALLSAVHVDLFTLSARLICTKSYEYSNRYRVEVDAPRRRERTRVGPPVAASSSPPPPPTIFIKRYIAALLVCAVLLLPSR